MSMPKLAKIPEEMGGEDAVRVINDAITRVCGAGYVLNGELVLCRPRTSGLVQTQATTTPGPPIRVKYETVRIVPRASVFLPLDNWPRATAAAAQEGEEVPDTATGNVCDQCGGSRFQRTGTCMTCLDCGTPSGGCS